jgi:hypothetical protein
MSERKIVNIHGFPMKTKEPEAEVLNKRLTNVELITELMEFSKMGGMGQIFIMAGLHTYAETVVSQPRPEPDPRAFICPTIWWDCAKEILDRINEQQTDAKRQTVEVISNEVAA